MRLFSLILGLLIITLTFQNCGDSARNQLVLLDQVDEASLNACEGQECLLSAELLWLLIREYEPYRVDITSLVAGHFTVGGQCGVGAFANHSFVWELREGFGAQRIVGRGVADNRCDLGQFQIPIVLNIADPEVDQRYQLLVEIVGIDENNSRITNPQPAARGALDIIFEGPI
ncbi:MAG: hypothetical protein AAF203_11205 [Pseudomonadota bacterium]